MDRVKTQLTQHIGLHYLLLTLTVVHETRGNRARADFNVAIGCLCHRNTVNIKIFLFEALRVFLYSANKQNL